MALRKGYNAQFPWILNFFPGSFSPSPFHLISPSPAFVLVNHICYYYQTSVFLKQVTTCLDLFSSPLQPSWEVPTSSAWNKQYFQTHPCFPCLVQAKFVPFLLSLQQARKDYGRAEFLLRQTSSPVPSTVAYLPLFLSDSTSLQLPVQTSPPVALHGWVHLLFT